MSTTTRPDRLNGLPRAELVEQLLACLDIPRWAADIADQRPFADDDAVYRAADAAAPALTREELDQALAAHPRIGDRPQGTGTSANFSRNEQAGVGDDAELARALREGNEAYERRFGHVYLVCASGRSGAELLEVLHSRLDNEPETELRIVEDELRKIARLRLAKVIEG
ncbi:2-oxo-4-hydroxy-4-carboxy-5-ureidoimidazoline decarboxylase [Saccharopolyspora antimicrobica]|uniref:2-oxo-4-hydroxy-4-carboxy-5-ureidoimidazoline decarboxylase n=1 Tax=Saccharopolyspora antimicrobica TaxID=455193 RepID=A0A1I5DDA3_9PSEU|nr:2-oxo-4-hydroxy-4-carboxy-5-ureidoimidazoline decarboxylase [Saccharopolyspora antimicrobica]RKT85155.1 2-oxo-4-hydroxy-4-carboxy-5-ureidoimidazoline decarboxylase [Saccharopolyspora antimicrobica]SFN97244.1 2-oxo-4-hydroxy-4-carboxy-5-ureidoimidazoline decarboxylase [Saccharopolyspora antimicrobica]